MTFVNSKPDEYWVIGTVPQFGMQRVQKGDAAEVMLKLYPSQVFDAEVFALHGIDVAACDLVVLKSSQHFRAGFTDLATEILTADSPGLTTLRVENFPHARADGPRWPLDPHTTWAPDD